MRQQSRRQRQQQQAGGNSNSEMVNQMAEQPVGELEEEKEEQHPVVGRTKETINKFTSSQNQASNIGGNQFATSSPASTQTSHSMVPFASQTLARVRSMDQEQEEHEVAVRRARRCNTNMLRLASLDPQHHPLRYSNSNTSSSTSNSGASSGARLAYTSATQQALKSLTRSATRPALPVGGQPSPTPSVRCGSSPAGSLQDGSRTSGGAFRASAAASAATTSNEQQQQQQQQNLKRSASLSADDEVDDHALTIELKTMVEALNNGTLLSDCLLEVENSEELKKIKKVQGFFRGWLCRRRWKQIVQEYIKSPHAELMRKRNNLVFRMVECEEEYVEQLTLLISAFLRPIKMAASSQKPALNHDELNSIFLNSETLLFLHQIFLKGLTARMESWPTLVLGDLFNMLLPMLTIYQEYVRNHHFSLQVLAECKQRDQFSLILRRLEEKPQLNGRTLETFLTYPMHQVSEL